MNCAECNIYLQEMLDETLSHPTPELQAHIDVCVDCRADFRAAGELQRGLRAQPPIEPPAGLANSIVAVLAAEQRRDTVRVRTFWIRAATAASIIGVAIAGIAVQNRLSNQSSGSSRVAAGGSSGPEKSAIVATPAPTVNRSIEEASDAIAALINQTADETIRSSKMLLPDRVVSADVIVAEGWPPALDASTQTLREAGFGLAASIEPMTNSARRAVNLFLQEFPPTESNSQ